MARSHIYWHKEPLSKKAVKLKDLFYTSIPKDFIRDGFEKETYPQSGLLPTMHKIRAYLKDSQEVKGIRVDVFQSSERVEKTLLYVHGGGFFSGISAVTYEFLMVVLNQHNCRIIVPHYSLLPESNYSKVMAELKACIENENDTPFYWMGDSAGAFLCLALAKELQKTKDLPQPKSLLLLNPWLDVGLSHPKTSERIKTECFLKDEEGLRNVGVQFVENEEELLQIQTFQSVDIKGFPSVHTWIGTSDICFDAALELHRNITDKNGESSLYLYDNLFHNWMHFTHLEETAKVINEVKSVLNT